ncbi:MAG: ATP-binding protein [Candidatus Parabeggiatoa sp.]|nr:ATP-binding protein [Candidatus Parabeggiatoa sp.]
MNTHINTGIPDFLESPPCSQVNPPVITRKQELPFLDLQWEDFEKLCLRLARLEANIEHCQFYGTRGQNQEGIDLYARVKGEEKYRVYQCKREKSFGPAKIKEAVSKFLQGAWANKTDTFILCTIENLVSNERSKELEIQATRLKEKGINFLSWGSDELSAKLKDHPKIVDDFFGRDWAIAFCGQENVEFLEKNISVESLKSHLKTLSQPLLNWETTLSDGQWLERQELNDIQKSLNSDSSTTLLLGKPGSGKSALLARLGKILVAQKITVFAIKADFLSKKITTQEELAQNINLPTIPQICVQTIARTEQVFVLIDQLDALSDLMVLYSERLHILLDLINALSDVKNVHIVASCRTFEHQHDPRLRHLKAEIVNLELPVWDDIAKILDKKGIKTTGWNKELCDILRAPQHLLIFEEVYQGITEQDIFHSYYGLLDKWWEMWQKRISQSESNPDIANKAADLVEKIAIKMADQEELWLSNKELSLSLVHYQKQQSIIKYLEANNILICNGNKIGFSHQTLFEYTRARAFVHQEGTLSQIVLARQNSFFIRPQLLYALHYARETNYAGYKREFAILWKKTTLRQHLKFLLIEFLGQLTQPEDFEVACLLPYLKQSQYRRRVIMAMQGSEGWFARLDETHLPILMCQHKEEAREVVWLLIEAWRFAKDKVLALINNYWLYDTEKDELSWLVFGYLEEWDQKTIDNVCNIAKRTSIISPWNVNNLAKTISVKTPELAPLLLKTFLERRLQEIRKHQIPKALPSPLSNEATLEQHVDYINTCDAHYKPYMELLESSAWSDLHITVEAAAKAFLYALWDWFIKVLQEIADEPHPFVIGYRPIHRLHDFRDSSIPIENYPLLASFETAVVTFATHSADDFLKFVERYQDENLLPIQRLLAYGMEKLVESNPDTVLPFLLSDKRRFVLGHFEDSHSDSKQLITTIVPHLNKLQREKLETAISQWKRYSHFPADDDVKTRFNRIQSNREHRLRLWRAFPRDYMSEKTKQLVAEEERAFPNFSDDNNFGQIRSIEPCVSSKQMEQAKDKELLKVFSELTDNTGWDHPRYHDKGGMIPVAREFEKLAEEQPKRVVKLISHLQPKVNEITVGRALTGLSKTEYEPEKLFALILELHQRGFQSDDFRQHAARALDELLNKNVQLPNELLSLLESWLEPVLLSEERNVLGEQVDKSDNQKESHVSPVLWGMFGGSHILPEGNYSFLSTLCRAYLLTNPPSIERWLYILETNLERSEKDEVWESLAIFYLRYLSWAEPNRVESFLDKLFTRFPNVRDSQGGAFLIANMRFDVINSLIEKWLIALRDSHWTNGAQAYAEILLLYHLNFPENEWAKTEVDTICLGNSKESLKMRNMRIGLAFTTVNLWSDLKYNIYRERLTEILLYLIPDADDQVQNAVSGVYHLTKTLIPDDYTELLLDALYEYPAMLRQRNSEFLLEHLEKHVLTMPKQIYQICNAYLNEIGQDIANPQMSYMSSAASLVSIALNLQRSDEPYRSEGLALFERMLALDVYDARETLIKLDNRPSKKSH